MSKGSLHKRKKDYFDCDEQKTRTCKATSGGGVVVQSKNWFTLIGKPIISRGSTFN